MGRKAKLKKIRREMAAQPLSEPEVNSEPTNFVNQLEQQGYQLDQAERCPELPDQRKNQPL